MLKNEVILFFKKCQNLGNERITVNFRIYLHSNLKNSSNQQQKLSFGNFFEIIGFDFGSLLLKY